LWVSQEVHRCFFFYRYQCYKYSRVLKYQRAHL
jgi:hypothetical protein